MEKIQVQLKCDKSTVHFTRRHVHSCDKISLIFFLRRNSDKSCRENENTHFMFNNVFPKILPFMR